MACRIQADLLEAAGREFLTFFLSQPLVIHAEQEEEGIQPLLSAPISGEIERGFLFSTDRASRVGAVEPRPAESDVGMCLGWIARE